MNERSQHVVTISTETIIKVALFGLLIVALYYLRDIVTIVLMSIVIASFVEGGVYKLKKWHFHRTLSVVLIYVLVLVGAALLFYVFVPLLLDQVTGLINLISLHLPSSIFFSDLPKGTLSGAQGIVSGISHNASLAEIINQISKLLHSLGGGLFTTARSVLWAVFKVVLIVVMSFYLSIQDHGVENFLRIITPEENEAYIISLWQRTERKIGLWFQGQLLLGLIVGVLVYLGLIILRVDYALIVALIAAVLELIPFGMILAVVPALYFAYGTGGISLAAPVAILYLVIQQFEAHVLTPLVVQKVVGISPLVVILSLVIGAKVGGFYGIILSIPVAVCLLEFFRDVEKRKIRV